MIFELADDFEDAVTCFPRVHPAFEKISHLRDAILASSAGLAEQPQCFTQTITNHLRRRPISPAARELIDSCRTHLASLDWWIRAEDGIAETTQWNDIIAVSPRRGLVHCMAGQDEIVDCRIDTQQVVDTHDVPVEVVTGVGVCPGDGRVAVVGTDGVVRTDDRVELLELRPRSNCFAGLGDGFIGVDKRDNLVYWDGLTGDLHRLAPSIETVGCAAFANADGNAAVVISGDRPGKQRVFLVVRRSGDSPVCREWRGGVGLVTAACLDDRAKILVLATSDRRLSMFDVESGEVQDTISLSRSAGRPLGEVIRCACVQPGSCARVVFSDVDGVVGLWNISTGDLRRVLASLIESPHTLVCLEWLADGDHFVVAHRDRLLVVDVREQLETETASAVTACGVGSDWVTLLHEKSQRIIWYKDGVIRDSFYHSAFRPRCLTSCGADGEVLVGGRGSLCLLRPGRRPDLCDALDLFDRPVVAVLHRDREPATVVCETGEIKRVRLAEEQVEAIQPPMSHWRQAGACWLGDTPNIVCWGRSIADDATSRIYVLRADGAIEEVYSGRNLIAGVASSRSRLLVCAAVGEEVIAYAREGHSWRAVMRRRADIKALAALGEDHLIAVPTERKWLEMWSTADSLKTVALCYTPVSVRSLSTAGNAILLGADDGSHVHLTVHRPGR